MVEDEVLIHSLLQVPLEEGGFEVDIVTSARAAVAALETPDAGYRALVTDIRLGRDEPTGWDVARRAREIDAGLSVVYITGDGARDQRPTGCPASLLLNKPFAPAQVVTAVAQLLNAAEPRAD